MRKLKCELKARDLINKSDQKSKSRSRNLRSQFEKTAENEVYFSVSSQSNPGKKHIVIISAPSITEDLSLDEIKKVIQTEDIKVACSCDAFLYQGYRYLTYKAQSGIDPEGRVPTKRNPRQQGMLCKHILSVLKYLGVPF
jgi:hypothetical protein